jgi:hypothetical protein
VALGPLIDAGQRDKVHALVTSSVDGGAKLSAGGTFEGLFYQPTVLSEVSSGAPAFTDEIFGPRRSGDALLRGRGGNPPGDVERGSAAPQRTSKRSPKPDRQRCAASRRGIRSDRREAPDHLDWRE